MGFALAGLVGKLASRGGPVRGAAASSYRLTLSALNLWVLTMTSAASVTVLALHFSASAFIEFPTDFLLHVGCCGRCLLLGKQRVSWPRR